MSAFLRSAVPRTTASAARRTFSTTAPRDVARISIIGNLADTPELQPTSTGREVLKYAVASNSGPRDNRQTSWFRVASFEAAGPRRDYLQSLPKGYVVDHLGPRVRRHEHDHSHAGDVVGGAREKE